MLPVLAKGSILNVCHASEYALCSIGECSEA